MKKGGRRSSNVIDKTGALSGMGGPNTRSYKSTARNLGRLHLEDYKAVQDNPEISKKMDETLNSIRRNKANPFASRVRFE
jgi:hypothetical protein